MEQNIKVATLFAGCGGGCLGVKGGFDYLGQHYSKHATEIVFANEIDKYACQTYKANFGADSITEGDIRTIPSEDIPNFDMLTGGFPCQSFSMSGPREGMEDVRGMLFMQIVRLLQDKQPKTFVCENVTGLLSSNKGADFNRIYTAFKNCGYTVFFKILNAANYGVPQKRKRIFIVGFRADLAVNYFIFPSPLSEPVPLKMVLESDIPEKYFFSEVALQGRLRKEARRGSLHSFIQNEDNPCHTITAHLHKSAANCEDPVILEKYEQSRELPCATITANLSKKSSVSYDPVFKEKGRLRRLTPLEAQRIQSFPDSFLFPVSETQAYKQIGNAIAPVMMWHVVNSVLKYL